MKMLAVGSEVIVLIGYRFIESQLWVKLASGPLCRYEGVPRDLYQRFLDAPSKGKFYNSQVKSVSALKT